MVELQRDQKRFHRAQRPQRDGKGQRQPQRGVQPERRLVFHFHDQRRGDDDRARDHDDEDRRPVAGVDEGIVEPAGFTVRPKRQESGIELALAAARAFAGDAAQRALGHRG